MTAAPTVAIKLDQDDPTSPTTWRHVSDHPFFEVYGGDDVRDLPPCTGGRFLGDVAQS